MKQVEPDPWATIEQRYKPGARTLGRVRNLTDFGAFIELEPGVDGLLHISDMSWTRNVGHPSEILKKGQELEAQILNLDRENKRISLGLKQIQPDPWTTVAQRYPMGSRVTGKVVRLTDFGAFVELEPGVDGLLHISQMSNRPIGGRVAVVELEGVIVDVDDLLRELKSHRENPLVKAVVIRINSPGGVVAPTQEVHAALTRLRESGKPVVASLGAVAASGGYYVAVAADRIYANPGTLTGSIGVIMRLANVDALMKKVGVDYVVVKAGRLKDIGSIARAMTPEERQVLQAMLDDVHGQFIAAVAAGRKLDRAQVLGFADGRVVSGVQAQKLKMIDVLGGLDDAVDGAAALAGLPKSPAVIGPKRKLSLFDLLRNQLDLRGWTGLAPSLPVFKTPLYLMD